MALTPMPSGELRKSHGLIRSRPWRANGSRFPKPREFAIQKSLPDLGGPRVAERLQSWFGSRAPLSVEHVTPRHARRDPPALITPLPMNAWKEDINQLAIKRRRMPSERGQRDVAAGFRPLRF